MPDERLRGRRCQPLPGLQEELTDGCTAPGGRAVPRLENAILDEQVDQLVDPPPVHEVRVARHRLPDRLACRQLPELHVATSVLAPPLYHLGLGYKRRAIPLAMRPRLPPLQLGVLSFPIGTPIDLGDGGPALPSEVVEHGAPNHRGAPRALHLLVGVEPRQEPFIEGDLGSPSRPRTCVDCRSTSSIDIGWQGGRARDGYSIP